MSIRPKRDTLSHYFCFIQLSSVEILFPRTTLTPLSRVHAFVLWSRGQMLRKQRRWRPARWFVDDRLRYSLLGCALSTEAAPSHSRKRCVSDKRGKFAGANKSKLGSRRTYCTRLLSVKSGTLSTSTNLQKVLNWITEPQTWQVSCYILLWLFSFEFISLLRGW